MSEKSIIDSQIDNMNWNTIVAEILTSVFNETRVYQNRISLLYITKNMSPKWTDINDLFTVRHLYPCSSLAHQPLKGWAMAWSHRVNMPHFLAAATDSPPHPARLW